MDPVVVLDNERLSVDPGGVAVVDVSVRNVSTRVESFDLAVLGPASQWAEVVPSRVQVYVQDEARATVSFAPPKGVGTAAGAVPFGVIARSTVDVGASASAEGEILIGTVSSLSTRLVPVTSEARWSARHRFEVSNWGNTTARLVLSVSDPDEKLAFLLEPEVLEVPVGSTAAAQLRVRAREPFLRGTPVRRPFRITSRVLAPGEDPSTSPQQAPALPYDQTVPGADGALNQTPVLTRLAVMGGVGAVAGLAALTFLDASRGSSEEPLELRPTTPTSFTAEAGADPGTVRLTWDQADGVDTYRIMPTRQIDRSPLEADGAQNEQTVPDLEPGQERCFELVAVRSGIESAPTGERCAVATPEPAGGESGGAQAGEDAGAGGGAADGGGGEEGADGATSTTAGTPGSTEGGPTTVPGAGPTGGPPADLRGASVSGVFTNADELVLNEDRVIVVVSNTPAVDSLAPVVQRRDRLRAEHALDAHILRTTHYDFGADAPPLPQYFVYVPVTDEAKAAELCDALDVVPCDVRVPDPNAVASE